MLDSFTKQPIKVSTDGDAEPYLMVQLDQLGLVQKLLDGAGIRYRVDEDAISFNNQPFTAVMNLAPDANIEDVQQLLDGQENPEMIRPRRPKSGRRR
jgi:hypothetical protein